MPIGAWTGPETSFWPRLKHVASLTIFYTHKFILEYEEEVLGITGR